jgi:hypothetical protein
LSAKNVGFAGDAADTWVSAVMFYLRLELKKVMASRPSSNQPRKAN